MKRKISILLVSAMLLSLCGCGNEVDPVVESPLSASVEEVAAEEVSSAAATSEQEALPEDSTAEMAQASAEEPEELSEEERNAQAYDEAIAAMNSGDYVSALEAFRALGEYEDAAQKRREAAYGALLAYLKENGSSIDPIDNGWSLPYGLYQEGDDSAFSFAGLDDKDVVCLGVGRNVPSDYGTVCWEFHVEIPEEGNTANYYFNGETAMSLLGRSTQMTDYGTSSFDITSYNEESELGLTVTETTVNYLGEESTEEKDIAEMYNANAVEEMNTAPITVFSTLLAETGVTLGDLGFTLLDGQSAQTVTEPAEAAAESDQAEEGADTQSDADSGSLNEGGELQLTNQDGTAELTYVGWEYLPDGVMADDEYADCKIIVILMDYTNYREDDPKEMQSDFWYKAYQNGVELDTSFGSYHSDQYEPLENFFKTVMMGGTIRVGKYFLLQDDSPVTIYANEQGNSDNKQTLEINIG